MKESDVVVHSKDQDIQDWSNIALQIKEYYENYHGFVILHGTDTMAYLASALSFMFENLGKSVIFTGSQVSLEMRVSIETWKSDFCEKHITMNELADLMCSMLFDASTIQLQNKYRILHGKCLRTVFTHELWRIRNRTSERSERVRFLIQNNECVNTIQSTFHVVLCLL